MKNGFGMKMVQWHAEQEHKRRGKNGNRMKIRQFAEFLRKDGESEKSSGSHKMFSLFLISFLNQREEIVSFSLSYLSLL
jgi:hypothetical protein